MVPTAILGCSGYAGQETLDRVLAHPGLEVVALGSDSLAGQPASALDVRLNGSLPAFVANDEALASGAELVFCCLGHTEAAAIEPPAGAVVVDLSGRAPADRSVARQRIGTASRLARGATGCRSSTRPSAR